MGETIIFLFCFLFLLITENAIFLTENTFFTFNRIFFAEKIIQIFIQKLFTFLGKLFEDVGDVAVHGFLRAVLDGGQLGPDVRQ